MRERMPNPTPIGSDRHGRAGEGEACPERCPDPCTDQPIWSCKDCSVTARFTDPDRLEPPVGWTEAGGEWLCLACARVQAGDAALARAGVDPDAGKATAIRAEAMAEFELRRDSDRADAAIARGIGLALDRVRQARRRLIAEGVCGPAPRAPKAAPKPKDRRRRMVGPPRPGEAPSPGDRADVELIRDPDRPSAQIAEAAGVGLRTVARRRAALRAAGELTDPEAGR